MFHLHSVSPSKPMGPRPLKGAKLDDWKVSNQAGGSEWSKTIAGLGHSVRPKGAQASFSVGPSSEFHGGIGRVCPYPEGLGNWAVHKGRPPEGIGG